MIQFVSSDPRNSVYLYQYVKILDPEYSAIWRPKAFSDCHMLYVDHIELHRTLFL